MNFSRVCIGAVVTTAAIASTQLAAAPARAIDLKGSITLTGNATVQDYFQGSPTHPLTFFPVTGVNGEGHFSGLSLNNINIAAMQLTRNWNNGAQGLFTLQQVNPALPFVDFGVRTIDGVTQTLQFILSPNQTINVIGNRSTASNLLNLSFSNILDPLDGYFLFGTQTIARGTLAATRAGNTPAIGGFTLSLTADPVSIPTPALLPGIALVGANLWRKRKTLQTPELSAAR